MQLSADDLADASRLIGWAARPKERPARNADSYGRLVQRYLDDGGFAEACHAIAGGAGINLHVDSIAGVVAVADADSPWRMPLSEVMKRVGGSGEDNVGRRKALVGAVLLATAKVAFAQPGHLDDAERVPRVSVAGIVDYLERMATRVSENASDADAIDPGAAAVWRAWEALRRGRSAAKRSSFGDQAGAVKRVCKLLEDEGHLQPFSDADGGTWRATPRFRTAVAALVEDSDIYAALIDASNAPVQTDRASDDGIQA